MRYYNDSKMGKLGFRFSGFPVFQTVPLRSYPKQ